MNRRELLRVLAAAGSAPLLSPWARALAPADDWAAQFDAATPEWKAGFANLPADLPPVRATVRGRFPDALTGTLFRTGPAGHVLGGERYHHWFDGDGMTQRFAIDRGEVVHQGRFVDTPKRVAEVRAGRRLTEAFGTVPPGSTPPDSPDSMNVANINVLPLGGELLALWEAGSAVRLDPRTLETRGFKTWRADLAGLPFSAHPKVDPDGTVWNFGVGSGQGLLVLWEIAPDGALRRADGVPLADSSMVHDFAVTDRHLVFVMPPLIYDPARKATGVNVLDAYAWRPELGMRVLVIDKKDWSKRQMLSLPAGFLFHVGNAWSEDTASGTLVHLDYARSADASSVFTTNREVMRGRRVSAPEAQFTVVTLNLGTGQATQNALPLEAEFPRIDPRRVGLRHRHVVHATGVMDARPGYTAIARTDVDKGTTERFVYGPRAMVEEHVYVPDGKSAGWVLGTVLDLAQKKTVLSCFAADALAAGPVAQATLPYALPLGLHGVFVPA